MAKELVKYKNEMNKLSFKGFTKGDMNLFMSVCSRVKEKGENEVILDFSYLRSISGYTATSLHTFIKDLQKMSKDVMSVNCEIITEDKIDMFNLFSRFIIDKEKQTLTVKVNPDFSWLLNEFADKIKGYTVFELQEFIGLQSKYAKNLYRILKQWRTTGEFVFNNIDDFREKLDVPDSYANRRLTEKIVNPSVREIQELDKSFKNFKCEPLYLKKRGKPLAGYRFTWKPEERKKKPEQVPEKAKHAPKKTEHASKKSWNRFMEFHQREYDFDELERKIQEIQFQNDDGADIEEILQNFLNERKLQRAEKMKHAGEAVPDEW